MRQASKALGRRLTLHGELGVGQLHRRHHRHVLRPVVGHVGRHDGVHQGRLVGVHKKRDVLLARQLHDGEGKLFREVPVRAARKGPVQVAGVRVVQVLTRRVVYVGERVRPLVQRGAVAVPDAVGLGAEGRLHVEKLRVSVAQHPHRGRAAVRVGADEDPPLLHVEVLHDQVGGEGRGRLIGMGSPKVEHRSARNAGVEEVDGRVHLRPLDGGEVIAQHKGPRKGVGDHDGLLHLAELDELPPPQPGQPQRAAEQDQLAQLCAALVTHHVRTPAT